MPLGANRITLLAFQATVAAEAEVIRKKIGAVITGSSQIDTAQYKFGGASGYFASSLIKPQTQVLTYGTDNWTFEGWFRLSSLPSVAILISTRALNNTLSAGEWQVVTYSTGQVQFNLRNLNLQSSTGAISANTWFHLAVVRSSNSWAMYINGSSVATGSESGSFSDKETIIGGTGDGSYLVTGHIDELRISNTARYTAGFTPSTTPFANDNNTLLLMHMDGADGSTRFDDDNGVGRSAVGLSAIGNAQIDTTRSKFGGASALFDGTGDYLSTGTAVNVNSPFWRYEGSWTVELFFNVDTDPNDDSAFLHCQGTGSGNVYTSFIVWRNLDQKIQSNFVARNINGTGGIQTLGGIEPTVLALDTWHYVVIQYDSVNQYFDVYINGTRTRHQAVTITNPLWGDTGQFGIGASYTGALPFNRTAQGWIDEVRLSSVARYSGDTITVPTAPFVNDSETLFLTHMDGTDGSNLFLDDNGTQGSGCLPITITANGNAQVDTAQSKVGSASALFDGTGDYLDCNQPVVPSTLGFTVECWFRTTTSGVRQELFVQYISGVTGRMLCWIGTDNKINAFIGGTGGKTLNGTTVISTNTWYHYAYVVDASGNAYLYLDGNLEASDTGQTIGALQTANLYIAREYQTNSGFFYGHLDEVRISKTARYTAGFTPTTEAFTPDANTLLLLHMDGADGSTTFINDRGRQKKGIVATGDAQIDTAQSKFGGASAQFVTSGLLQASTDASLTIPAGEDFTIEGWIRPGSVSSTPALLTDRASSNSLPGVNWDISFYNGSYLGTRTATLLFETGSGAGSIIIISDNNVFTTNTWYHFAVVRSSNVISMYVNGVDVTNNRAGTQSAGIGAGNLNIGGFPNGALMYSGHFDEMRWSNTARYTTGFTPSTTPFQNDANTLLLLHMDGTDGGTDFVDDNGVTTAGQP
jgi:hypothetical protein